MLFRSEIELLGFPLDSPFKLLQKDFPEDVPACELPHHLGRMIHLVGYYVVRKEVRTVRKETMYFGTWLDREGRYFDTVHFPGFMQQAPFRGKGIYRIRGKVVEEFGCYSVEVVHMEKLPFVKDERFE